MVRGARSARRWLVLAGVGLVAAGVVAASALAQQQQDVPAGLAERLAPLVAQRLNALREKGTAEQEGVPFLLRFPGDVGEIEAGTPVRIRAFRWAACGT
jgi:hypothetical protein